MRMGVVIPVAGGRLENLTHCLESINELDEQPEAIILVGDGVDGAEAADAALFRTERNRRCREAASVLIAKHEPGMEQPRNVGVRALLVVNHRNEVMHQRAPMTHVWFLDSDIIVERGAYVALREAGEIDEERILVAPYDWMPEGAREPMADLYNDPRWPSFRAHPPADTLRGDLSAGLACFSGNLVWPIRQFTRVGGFWAELHHGRCEDGELGLRAVACGVPISFVAAARGWHQGHPVDRKAIAERNARDVPMLNRRHPWVEGMCRCGHKAADHDPNGARACMACDCTHLDKVVELFVVEEDGRRFNCRCHCGWEGNTAEIWAHQAAHA